MAAEQEAAWENPSATLRDPEISYLALSCVSGKPDTAVPKRLFVVADIAGPEHYHLGDEAMLEANLQQLRALAPDLRFCLLSGDPGWTAARYGVEALAFPTFANGEAEAQLATLASGTKPDPFCIDVLGSTTCEAIGGSDGLVISGGGNLCSTWPNKILERTAAIKWALHSDLPVVLLGQTLGPDLSADQRAALAGCLPGCRWVGVRDEPSQAIASALQVSKSRIHLQVDDAFFLPPTPVLDERGAALLRNKRPLIVVCLDASLQSSARNAALSIIATQLDALRTHLDGELVFLPNVGGPHVDVRFSDEITGRALASRLRSNLIRLERWEPSEARWLIENASLVVSTRYHPIVFSTAAGVPSVGIYQDDYTRTKLRGALRASESTPYCVSLAEVERGALLPLAMELWHRRDQISARLRQEIRRAASVESERWDGICKALQLHPKAPQRRAVLESDRRDTQTVIDKRGRKPMSEIIGEEQWQEYQTKGYLRLGKLLRDEELKVLQQLLDDIMLGKISYPTVQMQLDTGGRYEDLPDPVAEHLATTLAYRKLQGLEADPKILEFIRRDVFRDICAWHYGRHASVSVFRVMMMNKPAGRGTYLPWHQDAGDVWKLDRDPTVTTWIALDPATKANGCVQVIPGTHRLGLLSKNGSNISAEDEARYCPPEQIEYLELEPGEGLLLHNWLLHRSDINHTAVARRALSACYMDGRTLNVTTGNRFPIVFGEREDTESALPFLRHIKDENRNLREMAAEAQKHAQSLLEDNRRREEMQRESEAYVASLVAENKRREEMQRESEKYVESLLADNKRREEMRAESERYAWSLEAELAQVRALTATA